MCTMLCSCSRKFRHKAQLLIYPFIVLLLNLRSSQSNLNSDRHSFANKKITLSLLEGEGDNVTEVKKEFSFASLAMNTTVSMDGLTVNSYSTTTNEESSNQGAITLYCTASDGTEISVRTIVLYDEGGNLITGEYFKNKTISVKGMVDVFNGSYQIKVFSLNDIIVK